MSYLDFANLDEQIEKALEKYYPNYIFEQVSKSLNKVEVSFQNRKLSEEKKLFGFAYYKKYNFEEYSYDVNFTRTLTLSHALFKEEFEIEYAIDDKKRRVYWKLMRHER